MFERTTLQKKTLEPLITKTLINFAACRIPSMISSTGENHNGKPEEYLESRKQCHHDDGDEAADPVAKKQQESKENDNQVPTPLENDHILCEIIEFVGAGNHRYVSGVNRKFRDMYQQKIGGTDTYFKNVVASVPCAKIAMEEKKWTHHEDSLSYFAAKHGQIEVLKWIKANNLPLDENTCAFAAY